MRPAPWAFRVRLYRSLGEIINGYTKNLYEGLGRNPVAGFGAALFHLFVLVAFCTGGFFDDWNHIIGVAGNQCWYIDLVVGCGRSSNVVSISSRTSGWSEMGDLPFCHPFTNMLVIWILLRSTTKVTVQWKVVLLWMEKRNKRTIVVRKLDSASCKVCIRSTKSKLVRHSANFVANISFLCNTNTPSHTGKTLFHSP